MSQENAEQLLQLIGVFISSLSNAEERSEVENQITDFLEKDGSLFDLLYILQQCQKSTYRNMTIILIRKYICDLIPNYSPEEINQIKEMVISIIQDEPDFQLRISLCEVISVLLSDKSIAFQWEDIYEFADHMLNDDSLFATGLYLWSLIFNGLDDETKVQTADPLLEVCQKALTIDNPDSLVKGTKLLQIIFDETCSKIDYSKEAEPFVELLLQVLKKVFYEDQNDVEANSIVKIIAEMFLNEVFEPYVIEFAQLGIEIMSQEDLPLQLRLIAYGIIENDNDSDKGCTALLDSGDFKTIEPYFSLFISMMVQFLQNQREDSDFEFASNFFLYAGATIEGDEVFAYIIHMARQLSTSIEAIGTQVGLFLLYSIVESQQEYFGEYIEIVIKYITTYADCEDDFIELYAFRLLKEMAEWIAPSLSTKLDDVIVYIMKHINHEEGLRTLDYVLDHAIHPPDDLLDFLQTLINYIQQANLKQIELIICCIASSISSSFTPCEDVYDHICPVLNDALDENSEEIQKVAIRCFGNLSSIAPRSSSSEIEKLCDMLLEILTDSDYKENIILIHETIICVRKVCENLPLSFEPFFDDFAQTLPTILEEGYPINLSETERENQLDDVYAIQAEILLCMATFMNAYPQKMSQYADPFYQLLEDAQKNDKMTIPVCQSIRIAVNGFKELDIDCFPIFDPQILTLLINSDSKEMIAEIHNTLTSLMISCGDKINPILAKTICRHLSSGIGIQYTGYLMYELSSIPDISLIYPIFRCLIQFIETLGPNIEEFLEDIINAIDHFLTSPCKLICGLTIEVYAKLGSILEDGERFSKIAIQNILLNLKLVKIEMQASIARSLRYLLLPNMEFFETNQQVFVTYSEDIMKLIFTGRIESESLKHAIVAFWCSLVVAFELSPGEEALSMALSMIPPPPSDESIPSVAHFISFAMKNFSSAEIQEKLAFVAAASIASDESIICSIDQDVTNEFLELLSNIPEDDLNQFVFYNEETLLYLTRNMSELMEES